ncbi:hypothetical protein PTSG_07280 [Salpingoeca rosetta]|uniref:Uncharacterized protein n=1 Tax=Salpingoeca rosetta (strain ATCC 50818 / BSB-021) TaxID=946362 RepID=F2UIZ1_SALR5|nr:uncharacterized protein PTSG_07280 [Salpingoeca rosetta]EGD76939.1 hypothetical protein PTSG_07280 [Salpingoeca rosetta]|eukprot:XP_004990779.1 hypothetical protein PTSG_07280 [Salpingoeca rosetta]
MSGMMNKGGRIVEQPRDLMRAQVAMRPHVLSEQWRQKNPNAASTSMPLNAYVAEWQWHTGTISAQANAEPVRVTKGFQDTATNGIAAGEILLLHAKVKDRNMMCQDVYGHRFVISLACKAPFVKLAVNLGIAPKEWSKQLPVLSRDPHPRPITSFLKRDGTLDEPIAVALASEVTNRGVAKANCIVFLSVNNDAIVVCSSQREPQHAASSPSLIALPLDADVRVCAVPPSEAHHEYDVSWGTDYDVTVGAVSDSDLRRIGHRIHSDAQLSINSRIQAATKRRPRARQQQQQQQSPSGPRRASSSEDVSRRPRWSLFGGDRDGGDGGGVDGRTRGKKKNKKGARSGGDQFPLRSYPSAGQLQSGGQAGRVIALPPPSSSSSHHHHHHHHQAAPLASPSSAPMRGLPPSNTNNHWGDDDDDDDDYVRPVPLAGRYASADDLLTSDGYMAPQHLPRGEAEEVYSVANINTSGVDPFKYNKTAHAHANSSTSNSTSNSRSQRAVPPPASSRVGGGDVAAAVGGVAPPPPPASRAAVPPTLPKRTHQQQQQQQQQGGGDEEEFGFGAGTMDLNSQWRCQ